jgi:hypothetical protein
VLQRQIEELSQTQTDSETQSEPDTPSEPQLPSKMPESIKITKPDKFDGKDTSIATVTAWTFSVEEYMELAEIPADKQTRVAATLLGDTAKMWYINTYKNVKPLPTLEVFLKAFEEQHLTAHSKADVIKRAETIRQGTQRGANEYSTEFKMLVHQLGNKSNEPDAWVTRHYLRGLDRTVREGLIPHLAEEDTLDSLIKKATNIARNVEFGKSLDQNFRSSTPRSSNAPPTRSSASGSLSTPTKSTTGKKYTSKLNDGDREYLRNNNGCFWCRKINVDHMATNCPDRLESADKTKEVKKESVSTLEAVVESDSDIEYPRPSVPTIKIATIIKNTGMSALADSGATINLISSDKVEKHAIPTQPTSPVRIHEPMNPHGVLINKKVVSKVRVPEEDWESSKPAELLVAPLQNNDVILGMPFLASENILIDPAQGKVILPTNEGDKEDDVAEDPDEDNEDFDWDYYPATVPSICPKMPALPKVIPPDLSWIAALKDFDISPAIKTLDNDDNNISPTASTLKEALRLDKNYLKLNEKYIYEFDDVFTDKLPNKLPSPDAPRHRIVLEDEKMSINGRMFRLPTRYWPQMRDFLDEHLAAGRIRRSSSHIASGTWMIPKDDPIDMPRVVHDYRGLNAKTVKDHTPLTRQDDIIEKLAKGKIRGKIDLICAYYQILMEIADIHKTAFKTPFGTYE